MGCVLVILIMFKCLCMHIPGAVMLLIIQSRPWDLSQSTCITNSILCSHTNGHCWMLPLIYYYNISDHHYKFCEWRPDQSQLTFNHHLVHVDTLAVIPEFTFPFTLIAHVIITDTLSAASTQVLVITVSLEKFKQKRKKEKGDFISTRSSVQAPYSTVGYVWRSS